MNCKKEGLRRWRSPEIIDKSVQSIELHKFLSRFSLAGKGAGEKLAKENADMEISPSAEGEEGFAPSTSQAFEKA